MTKTTVSTEDAPGAVGPYVQGVRAGDFLFVSGQVALDPKTGILVEGGVAEQTERVLKNVRAILEAGGSSLDRVVKATVYLTDLGEFETMNRVYASFFGDSRPARVTVEVSRLPKNGKVEIDAIGIVGR
ncbi:MAG TPA: RidA family protein [Candidatus Polarisedimenticolaceae bacterium]|nr:RidA family protein [Candidatus Polarisedimenticolaceae bacterium]